MTYQIALNIRLLLLILTSSSYEAIRSQDKCYFRNIVWLLLVCLLNFLLSLILPISLLQGQ